MSSPLAPSRSSSPSSSNSRPFDQAGTLEGFPTPAASIPLGKAQLHQREHTRIFPRELAVIGEMLGSLESLTNAGQRHVMAKIVGFIQTRVSSGAIARTADRARVTELLDRVRHEATRPLPVVEAFRDAVGRVLAAPGLLL